MPNTAEIAEWKARLRSEVLARRDAMPADERAAASAAICRRVVELVPPRASVSAFLPIRSEVDLTAAIRQMADRGHAVGLPIIRGSVLRFGAYSPDAPLVPRGFGTFGPADDAPLVDPEVMLVPFSVFDRTLNRIGYGKAFYDTTIAGMHARGRSPHLIGIGFSVQETELVPVEPHDVALHLIVTERETIAPRQA